MPMINYSESNSIYVQIADIIRQRIFAEEYKRSERLQSVRDLAAEFEVNPNTMQRALSELEREGFLVSERTAGRYVTQDEELLASRRAEYIEKLVGRFAKEISVYRIEPSAIISMLDRAIKNLNGGTQHGGAIEN